MDPFNDQSKRQNGNYDRVQVVYCREDPSAAKRRRMTDIVINLCVGLAVSLFSATIYAIVNNYLAKRQAKRIINEVDDRDVAVVKVAKDYTDQRIDDTLQRAKVNMLPNRSLRKMVKVVNANASSKDHVHNGQVKEPQPERLSLHESFVNQPNLSKRSFLVFIYANTCPWAQRTSPQVVEVHKWIQDRNAFNALQNKPMPLFLYAINIDDIIDPSLQQHIRMQGIPYFLFYNANTKSLARFTASHPDFYKQEIENLYHALQSNTPLVVE